MAARRQRLQALCGAWQAGLLERQCCLLLSAPSGGNAPANAPSQGALLYALAWLQAALSGLSDGVSDGGGTEGAAGGSRGDAALLGGTLARGDDTPGARRAALESLLMTLMTMFDPYPFARQERVQTARDLSSEGWRQVCTPLLKQVLRAAYAAQCNDADLCVAVQGGVLARLRAAHAAQLQQEAAELEHGSDVWQQRMVGLHELETCRREELTRHHALQERQVARLWLKLQRRLTHQRAPWAPPHAREEAESSLRISKWENGLRQRCRLKRVDNGTRHLDASKARVISVDEASGAPPGAPPSLPDPAAVLPSGVALAKLCEGSDGEEWEDAHRGRSAGLRSDLDGAGVGPQASMASMAPQPLTPRGDGGSAPPSGADETAPRRATYECPCDLVTAQRVITGTLQLGSSWLTFLPDLAEAERVAAADLAKWEADGGRGERPADKLPREKEWALGGLTEIHRRRYLLRASALELFWRDAPPCFFQLREKGARRRLLSKLRAACPRAAVISPADTKWVAELSARWQAGAISNFEYLQRLNTLAGRTYNDLNQYPVFPWVLADYTSPTLDLSDPSVFRDLRRPMGAQRTERQADLHSRFEQLRELDGMEGQPPAFHHGSHYSSAAIVLYYLIRLEPFTTLAIRLQGGFFDHADRLFHSVGATFANATTNTADVKEAIPELYYLPELLRNVNGINLGVRQDGVLLDDVLLPPWASGPHDFIRKHRQALESELVSAQLHEWVDLVFGYKQRGPAAEEALNVFYYLTYEGAVDLDAISDPRERAATEAQITHFGNTPSQLFTRPHPPRRPPGAAPPLHRVCAQPDAVQLLIQRPLAPGISAPILSISLAGERLHSIGADRRISTVRWLLPSGSVDVASLAAPTDGAAAHAAGASSATGASYAIHGANAAHTAHASTPVRPTDRRPLFGVPFVEGLHDSPASRAAVSADGRYLFTCGYWDRAVKCSSLADGRSVQSLRAHTDVVSCLALTADGAALVTGSRDTTLMVWMLHERGRGASLAAPPLPEKPRHVLHGHDDEVTCVVASSELNTVRWPPAACDLPRFPAGAPYPPTLPTFHRACVALEAAAEALSVAHRSLWRLLDRFLWSPAAFLIRASRSAPTQSFRYSHRRAQVLSGSRDGSAIVYSLRSGHYVRTLPHPTRAAIDLLALSHVGDVVLYSLSDRILHSTGINQRHHEPLRASTDAGERLNALAFNRTGEVHHAASTRHQDLMVAPAYSRCTAFRPGACAGALYRW